MAYYSSPNIDSTDQILVQGTVQDRLSSVVTLGSGETFLSPWFNVENYAHQAFLINSDVSGTLYIQGASDNSDPTDTDGAWDTQLSSVYTGNPTNALDARLHTLAVVSRYTRVKYVNDGTPQTFFNLQSSFHKYSSMHYTTLMGDTTIDDYTDTTITRSAQLLQTSGGSYVNQKIDSLAFSTTANLTSTSTYTSGYLNAQYFTQVQTHVLSNEDGTLVINFAKDSGGSDIVRTLTIPYTGGSGFQLFSAPVFSDYIEYRFTNDGLSTQTDFLYETKFLTKALQPQLLSTESFISPTMVSQLSRSVIVGKKPDGVYTNVNSDYNGDLKVSIGQNNRSAFGEINISQLTPIVQEMFTYNINSRLFTTTVVNTGTVTQSESMAVVSSGTTTGSTALLETRKRARYRPGIGFVSRFTGLFTTGVADTTQIIGLIDDEDGVAFGYNGTSFGILRRSYITGSAVDTWTPSTSWNQDKADGTGTLPNVDYTKINVFEIQIQYLGAGAIRFYIENTSGEFILVHTIQYAGNNTVPSFANPSLPFHMDVDNNTTTSDIIVKAASCGIFIEGIEKPHGALSSVQNSKSGIGSTETNVITIQNRTIYNSLNNHNFIYPYLLSIATISGTKPTTIKLILNTTLGGTPSYTNFDTNNSILAYDVAGTTITGGEVLTSIVLGKEDRLVLNLKELEEIFLKPSDILTVSATTPSGSVEVFADITSLEDL